jgi:hypothetical protein
MGRFLNRVRRLIMRPYRIPTDRSLSIASDLIHRLAVLYGGDCSLKVRDAGRLAPALPERPVDRKAAFLGRRYDLVEVVVAMTVLISFNFLAHIFENTNTQAVTAFDLASCFLIGLLVIGRHFVQPSKFSVKPRGRFVIG